MVEGRGVGWGGGVGWGDGGQGREGGQKGVINLNLSLYAYMSKLSLGINLRCLHQNCYIGHLTTKYFQFVLIL